MKDAVLFLLCAVALANGFDPETNQNARKCNCDPSEAQQICEANYGNDNVLVAHKYCDKFYKCTNGKPVAYNCPHNLLYNPFTEECDWPENVECGERPISDGNDNDDPDCDGNGGPDSDSVGDGDDDSDDNNNESTCNCDPSEAPSICAAEGSNGILIAHENCNQFYMCAAGKPVAFFCGPNLLYNPYNKECDWPQNVECGDRVIPEPDDNDTDNDNGNEDNDGNGDNDGTCNCNPEEAPAICAAYDSDGVLVAHENCNQFYICNAGKPVAVTCPETLLYNPYTEQCDWPRNVDCGERFVPESEDDCATCHDSEESGDIDLSPPPGDDASDEGDDVDILPPPGDDASNENDDIDALPPPGDDAGNDSDNESGGNDNVGAGNCDPSQAPNICAEEDSDGVLVAHENCNQFYICSEGKPVVLKCPDNLLFNPNTDQCDWPENVDCGDRVIPDVEDDNNGNDNDSNDNDGSDNESGGNDNGDNDNESDGNDNGSNDNEIGGNDNVGAGNCDPSQAPNICAEEHSDGVLVAHENCNQFYICSEGKPVALKCPGNLLFNPNTDQCDWPENVDCGDRVIPDVEDDNNGNDNDSNDNDGSDNESGGNDNGDNDNESDGNDNGSNDNESGGNDNVGAGNCDPSQAPNICAEEDSDGVLVAHENCNQFYICSEGKPVALKCPGNLLFNPNTDQCDWPENVDCGDRVIPDVEDDNNGNDNDSNDNDGSDNESGDNDNGDNDNESDGNDNGSNDNESGGNDNVGAGNCDPSQAPNICAEEDSDGVLVAHENCNQFYICSEGKPVALKCPGNLLFNPNTDQCDWPENVDCGDRVIPDVEDDTGNESGSIEDSPPGGDDAGNDSGSIEDLPPGGDDAGNDSGSIDNESGGSDNVGAGNCDPSQAPNICAEEDSDGILVAHENCNQFYICVEGKPVALKCPANLLFNPNTDRCDWPENVDCGDRVIPDVEEDNNDNSGNDSDGNDSGGNDNESGSNDNEADGNDNESGGNDNESGGNDNGGGDNENVGAGNCDPSQAPTICAEDDSEGILVAHENCNWFYICNGGKPVVLKCPGNLLFNPNTDQCDWPENVDCGDRVIPDVEDDNNGNDNDSNDNGGSDNESGGNDNGGNDNESGGNGNGGSDSGSIEDLPPGGDDASNDSGSIEDLPPVGDDADNDSSSIDNESGGNDNVGAGNCDPSQAPNICAEEDSDSILVAHENCNQFYICSGGKPVALKCPGNLLFNPNTDQCDWPENVDCGDRVIPDVEDDNNGNDNDSNDNGGSDNESDGNDNGDNDNESGGNGNGGSDSGSIEDLPPGGDDASNDSGSIEDLPPVGDDADNDSSSIDNESGGNDNVGAGNCDPSQAPNICAEEDSDGILVAHENCNQFYICSGGKPVALKCPGNLLFNPNTDQCDWPENVDCGDRVIPDVEDDNNSNDNDSNENDGSDNESGGNDNGGNDNESGGNDNGDSDNESGGNDNVGAGNCDPSQAPNICAEEDSDGILVAHENCNQFYICSGGKPVALKCPGNLLFNPNTDQCDWPENVDCGDRVIPDVEDDTGNESGSIEDSPPGGDDAGNDSGSIDNESGGNDNVGAGNCDPSQAPNICAEEDSDGILVAHENCNQFYICSGGKPVALKCPGNLLFNPNTDQCDWPENVDCGDRVIPDVEDDTGNESGSIEDSPPGGDDAGNDSGSIDNESGGNDNVGAGNCDPSQAPNICAEEDSDGILVAHENCNQFYICSGGKPVALKCPGNLLFNPNTDQCDWPENVDCGDRVIPDVEDDNNSNDNDSNENDGSDNESGGNDNGGNDNESGGNDNGGGDNESGGNDNVGAGNCDPSQAPNICAEENSDGVLVAHENCNQFYICNGGKPVALKCPANLLFNPNTDQCDWPENVDCGDRVIPDVEDDNNSNDNDSNENDGSDNESGGNDNGGNDNESGGNDNGGGDNESGGNDNVGAGNCDPSQAPNICAEENSDGVLVAHENCNQFYICNGGKPVALKCPANLLFNPNTDQCDWPENVDCGDRVIPDVEDDTGNESGSIEDSPPGGDDAGNDSGSIEDLPPGGDDAGNDSGSIDNESGGNDNVGAGNCDPSQAPNICAEEYSDGILVAHENCNQFYICVGGKPIAVKCPANLLFNPNTDQCDWPENVDCGDRVIPDVEDDTGNESGSIEDSPPGGDDAGNDSGSIEDLPPGGDDASNDSGSIDNESGGNDNVGAGNCDPSQAPNICAEEYSDGILVAHENCNQFYICVGGKPIAVKCPANLLFNPNTDQCDWPENVDCGDRVIPDVEDDTGNESGSIEDSPPGGDDAGNDSGSIEDLPPGGDDAGNDSGSIEDLPPGGDDAGNDSGSIEDLPPGGDDAGNDSGSIENLPPGDDAGNDSGNIEDSPGGDGEEVDGDGNENDNVSDNDDCDCNCEPNEAASICAVDGSDGTLIAHEYCNHFYKCYNGRPVAFKCPSNLLYNPYTTQCDWPFNVECGDRVIPDPEDDNDSDDDDSKEVEDGDSDNDNGTCNCNPEEAPAICAADGSDGVLVAHEYCNQFYQCAHGKPVAVTCPTNLLYNPFKEICDWPENVECGDRVIPDPKEDIDDNDSDGNDPDDNDSGIVNDDPSQAPSICADSDSNGVLVAHENCEQFYICSGGFPLALTCAEGLLYNPITQQCDWPRNVDCGDRIVPETEDDCPCNPRNAPALCSRPNSNGKLIAHENCNQFYICTEGVPIAHYCAANLHYNSDKEVCDWPQNVDCNSRMLTYYTSHNKHLDSRQTIEK